MGGDGVVADDDDASVSCIVEVVVVVNVESRCCLLPLESDRDNCC